MGVRKAKYGWLLTIIFAALSILFLAPILIVFMNSFKGRLFISQAPFALPTAETFSGLTNYVEG
ncbi:MAG: carbohydrate ABC transporter permease, partial [Acetivibrio ethanolgignens]